MESRREGWLVVNGVPTRVLTWGGWVEDEIESDSILLCICGTPGVCDFYVTFLDTLYGLISFPVWVIGYAGSEKPDDRNLKIPCVKSYRHLYNLSGQVKHKEVFINTYVAPDKKLYLIAHSLGAKIVVELLKRESISLRAERTFLLFPTLESFSESKNGKFVSRILPFLISGMLRIGWILDTLPKFVKVVFLQAYFYLRASQTVDVNCMRGGMKLFDSSIMLNVFYLTQDGLQGIKDLDEEVLKKQGHKICCYYSKSDGWAPPVHYDHIRKTCPNVQAVLMEDKFKHAFVLTTPRETALELAICINKHRKRIAKRSQETEEEYDYDRFLEEM